MVFQKIFRTVPEPLDFAEYKIFWKKHSEAKTVPLLKAMV